MKDYNDAISHEMGQTGTSVITHALTEPLLPHLTGSARLHVNRNYDRNIMGIHLVISETVPTQKYIQTCL